MAIVKMSRAQLADKLQKLWVAHESAVAQRLEARDREALDKLAKALNMPKHVRTALDWSYTRTMIGLFETTGEVVLKDRAYVVACTYVRYCVGDLRTQSIFEHSENRRMIARCEGACAGYLFAAKERVGT